jgi:hypothetical protein
MFLSPFEISQYKEEIAYEEKNRSGKKAAAPLTPLESMGFEMGYVRHGEKGSMKNAYLVYASIQKWFNVNSNGLEHYKGMPIQFSVEGVLSVPHILEVCATADHKGLVFKKCHFQQLLMVARMIGYDSIRSRR